MSKKHYSDDDFIVTLHDNVGDYGYCAQCHCDMIRFTSDGLLRHYKSHKWYREHLKRQAS